MDSVLDLCCGSGVLSIIASSHSRNVTGIDINPRAIEFSQFNAILNNIHNCRFLHGNLYEPVKNEKYDLILSNPPYEIQQRKSFLYKDGGRYGYEVLKKIIGGIPTHLKSNGVCQIITRIASFSNVDRSQLIKSWIQDNILSIFFVELYKLNIYQMAYNLSTEYIPYKEKVAGYQEYSKKIESFLRLFEDIHLTGVSLGILTIVHNNKFLYKEHIFDSKGVLATELSTKLNDLICMHFHQFPKYGNCSGLWKTFFILYYFFQKIKRVLARAFKM